MKILFITANRLGDAVLTTGLLAWLVQQYPAARFTIACGPFGVDLFRAVPRLEKLVVFKKQKWKRHWLDLWLDCIGTQWDLIVDLRNSAVSRLLRSKRRVSHVRGRGQHKVLDNAALLGLDPPPAPYIWITPEASQEAAGMSSLQPILALGPTANWPLKQWPLEYFIELARILTAPDGVLPGASVMILADRHERSQIIALLRAIPDDRRIEIIGRDLQTVAAHLKHASLYVGNDSGLMHVAAALGVPTIGMFGPGYPEIYGPWGQHCRAVCTPESREDLLARPRDLTGNPSLMKNLSVEQVAQAAVALLKKSA